MVTIDCVLCVSRRWRLSLIWAMPCLHCHREQRQCPLRTRQPQRQARQRKKKVTKRRLKRGYLLLLRMARRRRTSSRGGKLLCPPHPPYTPHTPQPPPYTYLPKCSNISTHWTGTRPCSLAIVAALSRKLL